MAINTLNRASPKRQGGRATRKGELNYEQQQAFDWHVSSSTRTRCRSGSFPSGRSLRDLHPDLARSASPINYVHGDEPPMLVVHGTRDQLVPYIQAELLVAAMDKVGAPYYFHTVVGGGHNPYLG